MYLAAGGSRLAMGSTTVPSLNTFEAFSLSKDRTSKGVPVLVTAGAALRNKILDLSMLRAASEAYDISPDIRDYVLNEVPANNVGLPNRNMDCFELLDATEWRPELGRIAYHTYRGKACNANHDNKIPKRAKGMIFDSYLHKIEGRYHIMVVCGWCRQKDPQLANRIANRQDAGYSMACLVGRARCSVCDFSSNGGNVTCKHVKGGVGKGTIWPPTGQLVFEKCGLLNFHELSHVEDRADIDCVSHWVA